MNDFQNALLSCKLRQSEGLEISDLTARIIASMYYGGQFTRGYQFLSTGYIGEPTELWHDLFPDYLALDTDARLLADMFGTYILNRESKEAIPTWHTLHW